MAIQGKPNQNAIDARAKENAKKAKEMSEGIQYAIIIMVHFGASLQWRASRVILLLLRSLLLI